MTRLLFRDRLANKREEGGTSRNLFKSLCSAF
jgi:hypothetical protein